MHTSNNKGDNPSELDWGGPLIATAFALAYFGAHSTTAWDGRKPIDAPEPRIAKSYWTRWGTR